MPGTLVNRRQVGPALANARTALSNAATCSRNCRQHGPDDRRQVVAVGQQRLDPLVERKPAHRARQHAERLGHAADAVRQPRRHAHGLRPGAEQGTRLVGVKRRHVHRPTTTPCA